MVKLAHRSKPLLLDFRAVTDEQVLVGLNEKLANIVSRGLEKIFLGLELILLDFVELIKFVHFLGDVGEDRC